MNFSTSNTRRNEIEGDGNAEGGERGEEKKMEMRESVKRGDRMTR